MKKPFRNIVLMVVVSWLSLPIMAQSETQIQLDTIYFYKTWMQMLNQDPVAYIVNPAFEIYSPYEIYVNTGEDEINKMIEEDYLAFSQADSIWFLNSEFLKKKKFKGDLNTLNGFVPVYFNEVVAFVTGPAPLTVKDILFGNNEDGVTSYTPNYFHIDFLNHRVKRVTHSYLSELLEDYHDLQMRYEGMKDYKKMEIIEDFFFKYIDRATEDIMRPSIVDLVDDSE